MKQNHFDLFFRYYTATVGRYYTADQSKRLMRLFAGSAGIERGDKDFEAVMKTVTEIDKKNITSYVDSRNFQMMINLMKADEDTVAAADALVKVYRAKEEREAKGVVKYRSYLDWIISLRTETPKELSTCIDLAYYNYSSGNVADAISDYKDLINKGTFFAISDLAFILSEQDRSEEAYYYYALLKRILKTELKVGVADYVEKGLLINGATLGIDKILDIDEDVNGRAPFVIRDGAKTIGFLNNGTRRFTYECQ